MTYLGYAWDPVALGFLLLITLASLRDAKRWLAKRRYVRNQMRGFDAEIHLLADWRRGNGNEAA